MVATIQAVFGGGGGHQAGGLQPLVKGDAQEAQQGEVSQFPAGREGELLARRDGDAQDDDAIISKRERCTDGMGRDFTQPIGA